MTYNFYLLTHKVFTILICIIKLTEKPTNFHQVDFCEFCEKLMYLQYSYYRNKSQVQKKFQDGNMCSREIESVTEHSI